MASTKIVLTPSFLKQTQKRVEAGEGDGEIYTDQGQKNMELRIQGRKASWVLRYKGKLKTIGFLFPIADRPLTVLSEVKELRAAVKSLIDLAPDRVDAFLAAYHGDPDHNIRAAYDKAEEMTRPKVEITTWTFDQCVKNTLTKRGDPKAKKPIAKATVEDMETTFKVPQAEALRATPAISLTRGDFEKVRDELETEVGPDRARKFVDYSRIVLNHAHDFHGGQSGLQDVDPWWRFLQSTTKPNRRTRTPTMAEMGMTLRLAEYYLDHRLPGRAEAKKKGRYDGKHGVRINAFTGFLFVILSGQRQTAGLGLLAADLIPDPYKEGWWIASWGAGIMKGGRAHSLPIPPLMMSILLPYMKMSNHHGKSRYAFPAEKSAHKPINRSVTLGILKRLGDRDNIAYKQIAAAVEKNPYYQVRSRLGENDVEYWVPHDTRRTIAKVMDDAGIPGGASAVLAHKIDLDRRDFKDEHKWESQKTAQITEGYYSSQRMRLKQEAMEIWVNAVVDAWSEAGKKQLVVDGRYV